MKETVGTTGLALNEPLVFELGSPGRRGCSIPDGPADAPPVEEAIPANLLRDDVEGFPELSEADVARHFTRLSQWNFGVDSGTYPLGSCTMKYNPKINEEIASLPGFRDLHPCQPGELVQGALELMAVLEEGLAEISGMDRVTLQPSAGAQGELTGMMVTRAYHASRGSERGKILIPDTAHGTNPASSALCGYEVVQIPTGDDGMVSPGAVEAAMDDHVAALMLTNPNTLGIFEAHIGAIAEIVHNRGGLVYCDGANLNAVMGTFRPGDAGSDLIQFNLHKTFSTPHGGGGPGSGPLGVKAVLAPFLPVPVVEREGDQYRLDYDRPESIGRLHSFYGNFAIAVRAYTYIRSMGAEGLGLASRMAVLNANYIRARLSGRYHLPFATPSLHECVFSDRIQRHHGVHTIDIAKRLIDYGFHPPTIYFPLVVSGAIMIEPTETESLESIDRFVDAMIAIADEAETDPDQVLRAPTLTRVKRLDEVKAARKPRLRWLPG